MSDSRAGSDSVPKSQMAADFLAYLEIVSEEYVYELLSVDYSQDERDVVILQVCPDVPSEPVIDIRESEEIRVVFDATDVKEPVVEVCREDFPSMEHVNPQFNSQSPKSICLFAEPWQDRKLFWTNGEFLSRIFMWFQDAAEGKLHRDDQAVESLFLGSPFKVVLPSRILKSLCGNENQVLTYDFSEFRNEESVFLVPAQDFLGNRAPVKLLSAVAREQVHGQLQLHPSNFEELLKLLDGDISKFSELLVENVKSVTEDDRVVFMLFVQFPIKRKSTDEVERVDFSLFRFTKTLHEVAEELGVVGRAEGYEKSAILINQPRPSDKDLEKLQLLPLEIIEDLSREKAQLYGGVENSDFKFLMIGAGAIGSQIHMNLIRAGWGEWVVVDQDHLLPHNIVRHCSNQAMVGAPKSTISAIQASWITDESRSKAIVCDVLNPNDKESELSDAYGSVEVILDCSASVAVARHISRDVKSNARRVSAFIGAGMDSLVFLGEDEARGSQLDWLEMQMYRESLLNDSVSRAISDNSKSVRYGGSCRDRSVQLAQDVVGVMSGLASRALRSYVSEARARICIYNIEEDDSISCSHINPTEPKSETVGDWQIVWDSVLIENMEALRREKLPNETGGILLGSRDTQRKIVYVVDVLPEPGDSTASEKEFIRGVSNLEADLKTVREKTAGGLEYVGEWHSHPDGCRAIPSPTDCAALVVLRERAILADIPVLMAIVGESGEHSFSIGS